MTEFSDSNGAPMDTAEAIIGDMERVLGAEQSDDSQIASLMALSLESASNGDTEAPIPLGGDNPQKTTIKRNPRNLKRPPQAKEPPTQVAPRAVLAPVLDWPSRGQVQIPQSFLHPRRNQQRPWLYASGVSDMSQDDTPFDVNNNNND